MAVDDLGMTIFRMLVPEDFERANDDDDPNHINWAGFSMRTMDQRMAIMQEFKKRGVTRFFASVLSPPEFMKTNRSTVQGGHLRADMYDEYAEFLTAFVTAARKNWGIDFDYVSLQNELLFVEPYGSCVYNPQTLREAVRAVMRRFQRDGIRARILIPEEMMSFDRMLAYVTPTMADPETRDFPGDFCTHRLGGIDEVRKWYEATAKYGRENWMTETGGHPQTWPGAVQMACAMYDYLAGGHFNAWVYERISAGPGDVSALFINGRPGPKYYAAKHFFRFIRPGSRMVDAQSSDADLLASAYRHGTEHTVTVVLINRDREQPAVVSVALRGAGLPADYEVYTSTEEQHCELTGKLAGPTITLTMPPMSIVTLFGGSAGGPVMPGPVQVSTAPVGERVGNFEPLPGGPGWGICRAAELGNQRDLNAQLGSGVDVNAPNYRGWTALDMAAMAGKEDAIKLLLSKGADAGKAATDGWTPLHAAAACFLNNKYAIFKLIMEQKPDVNARTTDGWTPLHSVAANAHTGYRQDPRAAANMIRDLVAAGADPSAKDVHGRTPLHWAAMEGYGDGITDDGAVASALCAQGADVRAVDGLGRTPLHYAAEMGFDKIVRALVEAGAPLDAKDKDGRTPADLARGRELTSTLKVLESAAR